MTPDALPAVPWVLVALLAALGLLAVRAGRIVQATAVPGDRRRRRRFRAFLTRGERASALFDFVLTFPLFLMIVLFVVQTALVINARLVVGWAAFAAARSAVVHTDDGIEAAKRHAEASAAMGCLPIAARSPLPGAPDPALLPVLAGGSENPRLPGRQLVRRWGRASAKLAGARRTTTVEISGADAEGRFAPRAPVTVAVTHDYRLAVPWAGGALGRLVGEVRPWGPVVPLQETVTLVNQGRIRTDGPVDEDGCPELGDLFDMVLGFFRSMF